MAQIYFGLEMTYLLKQRDKVGHFGLIQSIQKGIS